MEQAFTIAGHRVPVTVVKTSPNIITQIKTLEKDGYLAVQLGVGAKKLKHTTKPLQGHFTPSLKASEAQVATSNKSSDTKFFPRHIKEIKGSYDDLNLGDLVNPSQVLVVGDFVKVTGISKGKGFAGVVKRWGFSGGPKTHGQSDRQRAPGSIGQGTTPGRVLKGKKMGGRMGSDQITVKNLTVLKVDDKEGVVWLSGAVPGNAKGLVVIEKIGTNKNFKQLYTDDISEEVVEQAMEAEAESEAANAPVVEGELVDEGAEVKTEDKEENK